MAARAVVRDVVERGLVPGSRQGFAGEVGEHLGLVAQGVLDPIPRQHEDLIAEACPTYSIPGPAATAAFSDQGPGRRGPDEQLIAGLER